jgi:3-oxoacyl-[acyl-carrier-protein] synthase II
VARSLRNLWTQIAARPGSAVLSGATGVAGITEEEQDALRALAPGSQVRATADLTGHLMEAHAPAGVAMAAALIGRGDSEEAVVTSVGHCRGEGAVRLVRAQ